MPPVMRKRGRPKGAEKTVIGLPCKKSKKQCKPVPFLKKYPTDREKGRQAIYYGNKMYNPLLLFYAL